MNSLTLLINVALGLFAIYLFNSVLISQLQEALAILFQWRARHLKRSIGLMLDGMQEAGVDEKETRIVDRLYANPLIVSLSQSSNSSSFWKREPTSIPADIFTAALFETLSGGQKVNVVADFDYTQLRQAVNETAIPQPLRDNLLILLSKAQSKSSSPTASNAPIASSIPPPAVTSTLSPSQAFREEVENWFERAMDRASDVYKANVTKLALGIALVVVLAGNIDTFYIAQRLYTEAPLRDALSSVATEAIAEQAQTESESCLAGQASKECLQYINGQMDFVISSGLELPVGWTLSRWETATSSIWIAIAKGVGILVSGLAISQGAPFWFQVLNRVVGLRESISKRSSST